MFILDVLDKLLGLYMWVILISALISWVNPDPYNPIVRFLYRATEPVLRPIRGFLAGWTRRFSFLRTGIDLSPIAAILGIVLLRSLIASLKGPETGF